MRMTKRSAPLPIVKVVGTSASGKSTLVNCLRERGYDARPVSQEHSGVPDLWSRFDKPFALIYLSASVDTQKRRKPDQAWTYAEMAREQVRLAHAREAADIRIDTSKLSPDHICQLVADYLQRIGVRRSEDPLGPVRSTGSSKPRRE